MLPKLIYCFLQFVLENYDDGISSYSEIDEELLKNFGCQKDVISSPVSNNIIMYP